MIETICGTWTIYHSLAVAIAAGLLIAIGATLTIVTNEWLKRRADRKLARTMAQLPVVVDPDTVYDHTIHAL